MKRIQTYGAPGITVTFDPGVCIHSAVCLRTLPAVFDVRQRRWVRPEAATVDQVAAAVDLCPSGALRYSRETPAVPVEGAEETQPGATIELSRNGPLLLQGTFRVLDEDGVAIPTAGRAALCRCGGTGNQPFCDGTHKAVGFHSRRDPVG